MALVWCPGRLAAVLAVAGIVGACDLNDKAPATSAGKVSAPRVDRTPAKQKERWAFIEKMVRQGVASKVECPGSVARMWVGPVFYRLDFDDKQTFVSVVYAYYYDGSRDEDFVKLLDSKSGNEVGTFARWQGGLKMR